MTQQYYRFEYVNNKASDDRQGTIYVDNHNGFMWLKCPCGCDEIIILDIADNGAGKRGHTIIEGSTISPAIRKVTGCRSVFTIIKNRVRPESKYGKEETKDKAKA